LQLRWSIATTDLPLLSQWESSRLRAASILIILAHDRPFTGEISSKPDPSTAAGNARCRELNKCAIGGRPIGGPHPAAPSVKREAEKDWGKERWAMNRGHWRQIIITSNPTTAIPTTKKANAAASYSSQYLCMRMKIILHREMGEHQLSMDN
jgi:hypothetical protein